MYSEITQLPLKEKKDWICLDDLLQNPDLKIYDVNKKIGNQTQWWNEST